MKQIKSYFAVLTLTFLLACSAGSDGNNNASTPGLPILTTSNVSTIAASTGASGGTISSDGGAAVTAKGVCWSTSANPTITLTTRTNDGSGTGSFTSSITGLVANTTYYVRAYATNSVGTAYGNEVNFTTLQNPTGINIAGPNVTDIDGNFYASVTNCGLTFTKQNLNVSKYSDGTPIPQVQDIISWANLTTGAWCYYANNTFNGPIYGKLYNWYAVAGIYDAASANNPALRKKLAPAGWHIPTDAEWTLLTDCLGGESVAGGKMKATGTIPVTGLWQDPNTEATNASGFTSLPAGYLGYNGALNPFGFYYIGYIVFYWSSSEYNTSLAWHRKTLYDYGSIGRSGGGPKIDGFSVRCVRD